MLTRMVVVLFGALPHARQNALAKSSTDAALDARRRRRDGFADGLSLQPARSSLGGAA
jgi:hypothetical protein